MTKTSDSPARVLGVPALAAALYLMVSGGPYGLEALASAVGFGPALLVVLLMPLLWSLLTALMVGELSSALPEDGGCYVWVRRALGPFWGFQEAWLSLAASVFDMAIYPTLFVSYLSRVSPVVASHPVAVGVAFVALCTFWNLLGAGAVGRVSLFITVAILALFVWFSASLLPAALAAPSGTLLKVHSAPDWWLGASIAMWNFMGWDNAGSVAGEVRDPGRSYPRAVLLTLVVVVIGYASALGTAGASGLFHAQTAKLDWAQMAERSGGHVMSALMVAGACLSALGMFNALAMSYARMPLALAEDGLAPAWLARRWRRTGAPISALLLLASLWTLSLGLPFSRLVLVDILLYGLSLALEFVAFAALRQREPHLARPYRVPGGHVGAWLLGVPPMLMLLGVLMRSAREAVAGSTGAIASRVDLATVALGPCVYWWAKRRYGGAVFSAHSDRRREPRTA